MQTYLLPIIVKCIFLLKKPLPVDIKASNLNLVNISVKQARNGPLQKNKIAVTTKF